MFEFHDLTKEKLFSRHNRAKKLLQKCHLQIEYVKNRKPESKYKQALMGGGSDSEDGMENDGQQQEMTWYVKKLLEVYAKQKEYNDVINDELMVNFYNKPRDKSLRVLDLPRTDTSFGTKAF